MQQGKLAPRICFVVDLPVEALGGGAEKQCYLVARGLAQKGWSVAYLTSREGPLGTEKRLKVYRADVCLKGNSRMARYLRAPSLFRDLGRVNPDIVLFTNSGSLGGFVTLCSLVYRKRVVYRAASSRDADLTFGENGWSQYGFVARSLHRFAVKNVDLVVTNAAYVADQFGKWTPKKNIRVIRNGVEIDRAMVGRRKRLEPSYVLWMSQLEKWKNPGAFVKLAKALPDTQFVMSGSGSLWSEVVQEASGAPNLTLTGGVGGQTKTGLLERAFAFVNTSPAEGFPNTLLEAGTHSLPYISFVDPDEVICRYNMGFHVKSFLELVEKTSILVRDKALRTEMGRNIRRYVEKEHDIEKTASEYDRLLRSLLRSSQRTHGKRG